MSQVKVEVLASRAYSFDGDKGDKVNLVEVTARVHSGADTIIGKLNFKGTVPLIAGMYSATIKAAEKAGKLAFSLTDFKPVEAYPAK